MEVLRKRNEQIMRHVDKCDVRTKSKCGAAGDACPTDHRSSPANHLLLTAFRVIVGI